MCGDSLIMKWMRLDEKLRLKEHIVFGHGNSEKEKRKRSCGVLLGGTWLDSAETWSTLRTLM